jgi:hypothetical protein
MAFLINHIQLRLCYGDYLMTQLPVYAKNVDQLNTRNLTVSGIPGKIVVYFNSLLIYNVLID